MVKATDFKLGNWVLYSGIDNPKPTRIEIKHLEYILQGTTGVKPIPLTEDILIKAGFEIDEYAGIMFEEANRIVYKNKIHISIIKGVFNLFINVDDFYYSFEWTQINYVHQLQNLYFALTGTELDINL